MVTSSSRIKQGVWLNTFSVLVVNISQLITSVVLGRLLSPDDFGLIACISVFIAVGNQIVDSGMGGALVKKQDAQNIDYSTLFFFNLTVSIIIYFLLYIFAPYVARFYELPILSSLIRVLGLCIPLSAFSIVQYTMLIKQFRFVHITIVTIISILFSLIIAIYMAYNGYGVWSLVALQVSRVIVQNILFVYFLRYVPILSFSVKSLLEQFKFGFYLLFSNILYSFSENICSNVITKIVSPFAGGLFTQSNKFIAVANGSFSSIIDKSVFPVISQVSKKDSIRIHLKLSKITYMLVFPLPFVLYFLSHILIVFLLGEQWYDAGDVFQILSFLIIPVTVYNLNRNLLKSLGFTRNIFQMQIISSTILLIGICISIFLQKFFATIWAYVICSYLSSFIFIFLIANKVKLKASVLYIPIFICFLCSLFPFLLTLALDLNTFLSVLVFISLYLIEFFLFYVFLKRHS